MAHHAAKQSTCANCHYAFPPDKPDEFCPRCGQQNHDINLTFGHVVEEFLEGVFHFDGKVFRTARLLLLRPGELTRRFLVGHRMPYVPPIRLYVFISFIFFLVLGWSAGHAGEKNTEEFKRGLVVGFKNDKITVSPSEQHNANSDELGVPLDHDSIVTHKELERLSDRATNEQIDSLIRRKGSEPRFARRMLIRRFLRWRHAEPEEIVHQTLRVASISAFLLMPLAALLLQLAYRRQQRYYLGHLVFTIHLHCILFVLLMLDVLLGRIGLDSVNTWVLVLIAPYLVLALRRVYGQGWGKTIFKALLLSITYSLLLVIAVVVGTFFILAMG